MSDNSPHWKALTDSAYLGAWDFEEDRTLTIQRVEAQEIIGPKAKKDKRPVLFFESCRKPLILNNTNCKTIAGLYGVKVGGWVGKRITLYAAACRMADGTQGMGVRVRPNKPEGK